ncbi:hypothetical protein ABZ679_32495, partial [Streptomyces fimicarius]
PRMLHTIGFDKVYERAEGAYFWDAEGNDYLDTPVVGRSAVARGQRAPPCRRSNAANAAS